jgi:hypothetical protein
MAKLLRADHDPDAELLRLFNELREYITPTVRQAYPMWEIDVWDEGSNPAMHVINPNKGEAIREIVFILDDTNPDGLQAQISLLLIRLPATSLVKRRGLLAQYNVDPGVLEAFDDACLALNAENKGVKKYSDL